MIRHIKDFLVFALLSLSMFLPAVDAHAVVGHLWNGNCYSSVQEASYAFWSPAFLPIKWAALDGSHYNQSNVAYSRATNNFTYSLLTCESATGDCVTNLTAVLDTANMADKFFECEIPDAAPGLSGNGTPSVFSPMYETARTLVNTQALMIFLWVVATFLMGFKFGYFVTAGGVGGGKNDVY